MVATIWYIIAQLVNWSGERVDCNISAIIIFSEILNLVKY